MCNTRGCMNMPTQSNLAEYCGGTIRDAITMNRVTCVDNFFVIFIMTLYGICLIERPAGAPVEIHSIREDIQVLPNRHHPHNSLLKFRTRFPSTYFPPKPNQLEIPDFASADFWVTVLSNLSTAEFNSAPVSLRICSNFWAPSLLSWSAFFWASVHLARTSSAWKSHQHKVIICIVFVDMSLQQCRTWHQRRQCTLRPSSWLPSRGQEARS